MCCTTLPCAPSTGRTRAHDFRSSFRNWWRPSGPTIRTKSSRRRWRTSWATGPRRPARVRICSSAGGGASTTSGKRPWVEHRRDTVPAPLPSRAAGKSRAVRALQLPRCARHCDEAPSWPRHTQRPRGRTLAGVAGAGALRVFPRGSPETRRANDAARRGIDRDQAEVITNARRKSPFPWMARCSLLMLRVAHTPCSTRSRSPRCSRIATAAPGERRPHHRPRARTSPRATRRPPRAEHASCQTAGRACGLPPADGPDHNLPRVAPNTTPVTVPSPGRSCPTSTPRRRARRPGFSVPYDPRGWPRGPTPGQEHPENRNPPDLGPRNPREPRAVSITGISTYR